MIHFTDTVVFKLYEELLQYEYTVFCSQTIIMYAISHMLLYKKI